MPEKPGIVTSIKRRKIFQQIARRNLASVNKGVIVKVLKRDGSAVFVDYMIAHVVSRRVGGAVVRNLVKRRLRAISRELAVEGCMSANFYYLVIATPLSSKMLFSELYDDFYQAIQSIKYKIANYENNSGTRQYRKKIRTYAT